MIHQCGLTRDLTLFEAGDATEVGEKGLTLSGGQKARITLARAVYSPAKIILLDDVLAALDVHTSRWIVDKCFKGDLLRGRTVLLVVSSLSLTNPSHYSLAPQTHNIAMASPIADFVVSLSDGHIVSQGSVSDALQKDARLVEEVKHEEEALELEEDVEGGETADDGVKAKDGKLTVAEEIAVGHVSWPACMVSLILFVESLVLKRCFSQTILERLGRQMAHHLLGAVPRWLHLLGVVQRNGDVVAWLLGQAIHNSRSLNGEGVIVRRSIISEGRRTHPYSATLGCTRSLS